MHMGYIPRPRGGGSQDTGIIRAAGIPIAQLGGRAGRCRCAAQRPEIRGPGSLAQAGTGCCGWYAGLIHPTALRLARGAPHASLPELSALPRAGKWPVGSAHWEGHWPLCVPCPGLYGTACYGMHNTIYRVIHRRLANSQIHGSA